MREGSFNGRTAGEGEDLYEGLRKLLDTGRVGVHGVEVLHAPAWQDAYAAHLAVSRAGEQPVAPRHGPVRGRGGISHYDKFCFVNLLAR